MTAKNTSNIVRYWADNHLVVSGNSCRLIDNTTNQEIFHCQAASTIEAVKLCAAFSRNQWEKARG